MEKSDYIANIQLQDIGPCCGIAIHIKYNQFDYDMIEPIFINAMKEIYRDSFFHILLRKKWKYSLFENILL